MLAKSLLAAAVCWGAWPAAAEPAMETAPLSMPLYGQRLTMSVPATFAPLRELTNGNGNNYMLELIETGRTRANWNRMVTVGAARGMRAEPTTGLAEIIELINHDCDDSFSYAWGMPGRTTGYPSQTATIRCGTVRAGADVAPYSETTLAIVIQGERDVYTVQWAERGTPTGVMTESDLLASSNLYQSMLPISLGKLGAGPAPAGGAALPGGSTLAGKPLRCPDCLAK